jgi:hypothetical protein
MCRVNSYNILPPTDLNAPSLSALMCCNVPYHQMNQMLSLFLINHYVKCDQQKTTSVLMCVDTGCLHGRNQVCLYQKQNKPCVTKPIICYGNCLWFAVQNNAWKSPIQEWSTIILDPSHRSFHITP